MKSYNLIQLVTFHKGGVSIHLNDEIIKFVIEENSNEMFTLKNNLKHLSKNKPESKIPVLKLPQMGKRKKATYPRFKIKTPETATKSIFKTIMMVVLVITISFVGTIGIIQLQRWRDSQNQDNIMTEERLRQIARNIELAELRINNLRVAQQILNNQIDWVNSISVRIETISPSDMFFDWEYLRNEIASLRFSLEIISPNEIEDAGPYFAIRSGELNSIVISIHQRMDRLVSNVVDGINSRFSPASLLVDVRQDVMSIQTTINDKSSMIRIEIDSMQIYLEQQRRSIQR